MARFVVVPETFVVYRLMPALCFKNHLMINFFKDNTKSPPGINEAEWERAWDIAERIYLVLDYMAKGKRVSQKAMPEVVDEVMGCKQEKLLIEIGERLGLQANATAQKTSWNRLADIKMRARWMLEGNGMFPLGIELMEMSVCAESMGEYSMRSDGGLMKTVVERCIASKSFAVLQVLNDVILQSGENEWEGFSDLRRKIEVAALRHLAGNKGKRVVTKEDFGKALVKLLGALGYDRKPLLSSSSDWVAVFRVAIDVKLVQDNAYSDFVALIKSFDLPSTPVALSITNISNAYDGIYTKPVGEWTEEAYLKFRTSKSVRLEFFRRKQKIAQFLLDLLS